MKSYFILIFSFILILIVNSYEIKKEIQETTTSLSEIDKEIQSTEIKIKELKHNLFNDSNYDISYYIKNKSTYSNENLNKIEHFIRLLELEEQLSFVQETK